MLYVSDTTNDLDKNPSSLIGTGFKLNLLLRLTKKSNEEIIKGAGDYLKNLSELSRLTGESVDKLSQQISYCSRTKIYKG